MYHYVLPLALFASRLLATGLFCSSQKFQEENEMKFTGLVEIPIIDVKIRGGACDREHRPW